MNAIIENMIERRSCRSFDANKEVPANLIEDVLKAGLYAPTGRNRQESIFLTVTNKEVIKKLAAVNCRIGGWKEDFNPFYGAPVIIVVLSPKAVSTGIYDGSLAMENMMLAATSLGLGSCWIHRARENFELDEGKELLKSLGIDGEYEGIGNLALGYALNSTVPDKKIKDNRVFYIK